MKKKRAPDISVIIASYNSRRTISACLASLAAQKTGRPFEIIVVDSSTDGTGALVSSEFPEARLLSFKDRKYPGAARNIGIENSRAPIVAFIDADCVASPDWIESVIRAHEGPSLAIGGAIANGNPDSYVGWAAYFTEFSQWMPGRLAMEMDDIAGASMSYKKTVFERFGFFRTSGYCSDTEFHWRLASGNVKLRFDPSISMAHTNIDGLSRFLSHEFAHGRAFGGMRAWYGNFPAWKRGGFAASFPLIAIKLVLRAAWKNISTPVYLRDFLKSFPLIAVGILSWSLGEAAGYASGFKKRDKEDG
jgi:glycosyltransferase involved in cell wall biosynthesis